MRIISGTFRGRRLVPPKNITARPTTDFAKESLFNLLNNRMDFEDVEMLDLFAGTGGIGLEFISRGAREVTAVELAHTQQNFIIAACKQLGIRNLNLIRGDVFKFIRACDLQFDFIYADPPYALPTLPTLPDLIFRSDSSSQSTEIRLTDNSTPLKAELTARTIGATPRASLLREGGWFVLEHSRDNDFSTHPHFVEKRVYGSVNFSFFQ